MLDLLYKNNIIILATCIGNNAAVTMEHAEYYRAYLPSFITFHGAT